MTKKNLIIVGNKLEQPSYKGHDIPLDEYKQFIENADYVCRINRMHNYGTITGTKTDGLYIGGWPDFIWHYKGGEHRDLTKTVKDIYVDRRAWTGGFDQHCLKFITKEQFDNITVCPFEELKKHINYKFPCSVILMIDYFATTKPWCDEYNIWITGIDVDNREKVMCNGWQWRNNGHINGAAYELKYLEQMLADGKIKWVELELYNLYKIEKHVPIVIPVKEFSKRCPYKNETLLPITLQYIKDIGRIKDVTIISDGESYRYIANIFNIQYFVENRPVDGDEFTAIKSYLDLHPDITEFIWLPVTQPCRDLNLIDNILKVDCDTVVTSYVKRPNRSIYKLDSNLQFEIKDTERKGCMCDLEYIADGAIYYIKKDFINQIINSKNRNYTFWNSGMKFVENKAPFVDIDTCEDLLQYLKYYG